MKALIAPHEVIDSKRIKISDVLKTKGQKLDYPYDFGDYWQHSLILEKIIDDLTVPVPICCEGKLNCPPEDVGSLSGFYGFLEVMAQPRHLEHKELKEWVNSKLVALDGEYYSEKFYLKRVNYLLSNLDVYIKDWKNECNQ